MTKPEYLFKDNIVLPSNSLEVNQHVSKHKRRFVIIFVLLVAVVIGVILFYVPSSPLKKIIQRQSSVEIKTTYQNPFDKDTQYINPFEKYKNPFVANR